MLNLFWDERGVILEHYMPRGNTVNSATYADLLKKHLRPAIKSKRRGLLNTGVCCNMTMLGPILPVRLLQQSKICPSSVFHIRRTRHTSPPVTFLSLDRSKRRWEASLSGPTKAGGAWVAALSAKRLFYLEVSMRFWSAGTRVWKAMETTYKHEVIVYLLCSINYEVKNI